MAVEVESGPYMNQADGDFSHNPLHDLESLKFPLVGVFIVPLQAQQILRHYCATTASDLNNDFERPFQRVCQPPPHLESSSNHNMFYHYSKRTCHNMSRAPHLTPSPKTRMNGDSRHIASRASESGKFFLFFGFILAPWKVSSLQ